MKRFLAVILALGILVTVFAGCGKIDNTADSTSTAAVEPVSSAAQAEPAAEPVPEKKDVTISYMLSQGWLEDSERNSATNLQPRPVSRWIIRLSHPPNILMCFLQN